MRDSAVEKTLERTPGARPAAGGDAWWWLVLAVVGSIALLVVARPDPFWRIIVFVRDGIAVTLFVTLVTFGVVLLLGLLGALGRLSRNAGVRGLTSLYVELIRGIPLLVQIFFWYFAFPSAVQSLGRSLEIPALASYVANPIAMAILGMAICYGAYMTEVYRAGIQSIPRGQMEAARSMGMTYLQAMRHVVLPQAARVVLPTVGNEFISMLKDSSLVSTVAVADVTRRGREFMSMTFLPLETWAMIALLYLVMTLLAGRVVAWLEHRTRMEH